jgi:hypothetical protein
LIHATTVQVVSLDRCKELFQQSRSLDEVVVDAVLAADLQRTRRPRDLGGDDGDRAASRRGEYVRLARAMQGSNAYIAANELEPFFTARTVRVRDGKPAVTDGPAVQGEEFLTGYFLIEADSLEGATEWAAKVPNARIGSVEVRQVIEDELAKRMAAELDNPE